MRSLLANSRQCGRQLAALSRLRPARAPTPSPLRQTSEERQVGHTTGHRFSAYTHQARRFSGAPRIMFQYGEDELVVPSAVSNPFSNAVVRAMQELYPEELADKSWDNTGLLLQAPLGPLSHQTNNNVLLTIDLTRAVADEAIRNRCAIIIAYHPIIFRKLSSITLENSQQATLLRLAAAGISVYCPHTAVDAAPNGLGDWLADILCSDLTGFLQPRAQIRDPSEPAPPTPSETNYWQMTSPSAPAMEQPGLAPGRNIQANRRAIVPHKPADPADPRWAGAVVGMGRVVEFADAVPLHLLLERIWRGLGQPGAISTAVPQQFRPETVLQSKKSEVLVKTAAVCAGSGASLFSTLPAKAVVSEGRLTTQLFFTGEMSHHEALAAIEQDQVVIAPGHSVTERAFLRTRMRDQLLRKIVEDNPSFQNVQVLVSETDRDPFLEAIRL